MNYPCTIRNQPAQPFLAIRVRSSVRDLPAALRDSYAAITAYLGQLGQLPAAAPFAAYYNEDMEDLDVEIGVPTAEILEDRGNIYGAEIPASTVAECAYTGPYSKLQQAYAQLAEYMAEQGVEPTGVAYEIYVDDPATVPSAERRTLIVFPLKD